MSQFLLFDSQPEKPVSTKKTQPEPIDEKDKLISHLTIKS